MLVAAVGYWFLEQIWKEQSGLPAVAI